MNTRKIDKQRSTITLRTRAKGMLSRLAHDLEIDAAFDGAVELDDAGGWSASLEFAVRDLRVTGALKGGRVDRGVLSASDKEEIERRIRTDVLPVERVRVEARGEDRRRGEVSITAARGRATQPVTLTVEDQGGSLVAVGELRLSLARLGVEEIKGPLGAFRVDDTLEVAFHVQLAEP